MSDTEGCRPAWEGSHGEYTDAGTGTYIPTITYRNNALRLTKCGSDYTITAIVNFSGNLSEEELITGIKKYWEGTYDVEGESINLHVNIVSVSYQDPIAIKVYMFVGNGRSNTAPYWFSGKCTSVNIYQFYKSGAHKNVGWSMAHEFGHCLGIDDYYTHVEQGDAGFYKQFLSIMNGVGMHASNTDIAMVISAFETGGYQYWN